MDSSVHGILQARILEWIAVPFSRGSSQPRDQTQVSCIAGRFFTSGAMREALSQHLNPKGLKNLNSLKASRNHFSKRAKSFSLNLKEFKRFFCFLCLRPFWFSSTCLLPHLSLPFWIDSTLVMTDTYSENVGNSSSVFKSASSEFWIWFSVREGFHGGLVVKNLPPMQEPQVWTPGLEDPLEKGIATHSSIFAWRVP